jgi:hypothetical protein
MLAETISGVICVLFGYLYPVYATYKTLKRCDPGETKQWLMFWVVMSGFSVVEAIGEVVLTVLPFYYELKAGFVLWLVLPQTRGATHIYNAYVEKYLAQHEREIDRIASETRQRWRQAARGSNDRVPFRVFSPETNQTNASVVSSDGAIGAMNELSLHERLPNDAAEHTFSPGQMTRATNDRSPTRFDVPVALSSALGLSRVSTAL